MSKMTKLFSEIFLWSAIYTLIRVWDQCNVVQDYLTVYDGSSTTDPLLVRLCGGDVVPDIVSSGPNMLLEFHTSPFDNPFHPVPLSYLPGFELEVQVIYVDSRSHSFVREGGHCEFLLTSFDSSWGVLENPRHSLPPNTTCRYHFQGRHHETVWLAFVKYHAAIAEPSTFDLGTDCNARLRIWDGRVIPGQESFQQSNISLLGEFCKDEVPRLCDHTLLSNSTRFTRPCALAESYVSTGPELTIEQFLRQGSALYPVSFVLRYEFVDTTLEGSPIKNSDNPCDRVFTSSSLTPPAGKFQSPRSVFFYGRGGAHNLSCILRFEANPGERVKLTFTRAKFGDRPCTSRLDSRTGRWKCVIGTTSVTRTRYPMSRRLSITKEKVGVAELWVSEYPWPGVQIPRDCLCSRLTENIVITTLTSPIVEVNFTVTFMNISQDFSDFYFEGDYQFLRGTELEDGVCSTTREDRRVMGPSGEITFRSPDARKPLGQEFVVEEERVQAVVKDGSESIKCVNYPWLIEPEDPSNNFLYLKIRGFELSSNTGRVRNDAQCPTLNRIVVYSGVDTRYPKVICPAENLNPDNSNNLQLVEVFSDGWNRSGNNSASSTELLLLLPHARSFVVEFLEREPGSYVVTWMEVSKRPLLTASSSFISSSNTIPECPYRCPELNACISSDLWCDGAPHCPSGFDEEEANCAFQFGIPILYVAIGTGALTVLALLVIVTVCVKYHQHRRNERKKKNSVVNSNNANHLHINHLHNNGDSVGAVSKKYHSSPEDLFLDSKDSLC